MRDYTFRYLDSLGRTNASDHLKFMDNEAATVFGRAALARNEVVEVWRGSMLVITLRADDPVADAPSARGEPLSDDIVSMKGWRRP